MGKKIAVKIENRTFNSLQEACAFLKIQHVAGLAHALNRGNTQYKGLNIERISTPARGNKHNHKKQSCPVICENLNVKFKTITAAAKYAQADGWTMSKKMETAGQFVDKQGNIYKRLKAMKTKNVYENTGDTVKRVVEFHERPAARKQEVATPVVREQALDANSEVKQFIQDKLLASIKSENFTDAKAYITIMEKLK